MDFLRKANIEFAIDHLVIECNKSKKRIIGIYLNENDYNIMSDTPLKGTVDIEHLYYTQSPLGGTIRKGKIGKPLYNDEDNVPVLQGNEMSVITV